MFTQEQYDAMVALGFSIAADSAHIDYLSMMTGVDLHDEMPLSLDQNPKFEKIKRHYIRGFWSAEMVLDAAGKWLTAAEAREIIGEV